MATFMVGLDGSIMATAIPHITSVFDSLDQAGWYGSSYLLAMAALQPMCGRVYVDFDVKRALLCGIFVFEIGSALCAAATSSFMLIIGRSVAGGGASLLFNGAFTVIGTSIPLNKRAIYIATLSSIFGLTSIIGPLLGGVIVDQLSWRWCFWINLPIGAVASPALILSLQTPCQSASKLSWIRRIIRLDLPSTLVLSGSLVSLCKALQNGGAVYSWSNVRVWGFFLGSGLLLGAFIILQTFVCKDGFFPRNILTNRMVITSTVFSLLFSMALNA
ncbi:hypothetical protein H2200_005049 [Cladophialophora chaetospira]|uniref:Major facilitator superfamily (MFS) profile domain-containing protein n=1 Tax=Cladophialophora chaetospira TaxID=386627 RepID=A0AA38XBD6_9EURO|nr:hypothetical protein H2200_005049 [Cladophialophora chaetospira]